MSDLPITDRTRLRRRHDRGHFDRATIYGILDATSVCHVGYMLNGAPVVTPTLHWREGDHVYWHGSAASRALEAAAGAQVCLTVTLIDALVLARSGFNHSANYRSAMVFGTARMIEDPDEKAARLKGMFDALMPGRWESLRPMTAKEIKATAVLSLPVEEASAKIRAAGVGDDEEDTALPIWAGLLPVTRGFGAPQPDAHTAADMAPPAHLAKIRGV